MTKRFAHSLLLLAIFYSLSSFAVDIHGVGNVTQDKNGNDVLLFFGDEIHLRADTFVDWYYTDGRLFQSDAQDIYPDDGGYYIVHNGQQSSPVYAFLYSDAAADLELTLLPDCEATTLRVKGDVAPFQYTRPDLSTSSYARACTIDYNTLAWNGEQWTDSAVLVRNTLHEGNYILLPLYAPTAIRLCYDKDIRIALGLDSACYQYDVQPEEIKAVSMELTSLVTARGEEGERSNERNRPTSQKLITGSEYSGPLEIAFYSNPTPSAMFYQWYIYRDNERIATRQDKDIRYTFAVSGYYRVVCAVNNEFCASDSSEVAITISESYLAVPNVFTPNGDDKNDEFRVAYRSIKEFHCWVYNRWGKLVYEWSDPAKGWDGTINGRPASEGAYYYVIRALGTDAAKDARYMSKPAYNNKKQKTPESIIGVYQLSGDINLVR